MGQPEKGDLLCSVDRTSYFAPFDGNVSEVLLSNNQQADKGEVLLIFFIDLMSLTRTIKSNRTGWVLYFKNAGDVFKKGDLLFKVAYRIKGVLKYISEKAPFDGIVFEVLKPNGEGVRGGDALLTLLREYYDVVYNFPPWIFPTAHANEFVASIDKSTTLQEYTAWSDGLDFPTTITSNHTGSVSFTKEVGVPVNKGELLCSIGSLHKYRAPFNGKVLKVFKFQNEDVNKGDALILFGDVLSAKERIRSLIKFPDSFDESIFKNADESIFMGILDLHTHRLDAWFTSLATKRLHAMRESKSEGIYLGAYGWLEDLHPEEMSKAIKEEYIHAPSANQAAAAAILRNAFLTKKDSDTGKPFRINLTSDRVRRALRLLEGVREGQELGALLGYLFERVLHDKGMDRYIDEFRSAFPLVANKLTELKAGETAETVAARNVVNGFSLAEKWGESEKSKVEVFELILKNFSSDDKNVFNEHKEDLKQLIENTVMDSQDGMADILLTESMYQLVKGNFERAGAALDATPGKVTSQEIESVQTPLSETALGHLVCVILDGSMNGQQGPRSRAEPRLDAWFGDILGDMNRIGCIADIQFDFSQATSQELEILPGIGPVKAGLIITDREKNGDYTRLEDLKRVEGIGDSTINELMNLLDPPCPVSLKDLDISPLDFLYMSSFPLSYRGKDDSGKPVSEETELEQRMAYYIRKLRNLPACAEVRFDFERAPDQFTRSTAEAIELGQTVMDLLGKSSFLGPDSLWLQEDEDTPALYDIEELLNRVKGAHDSISRLLERFDMIEKRDEIVVDFFNKVINSSEIVERIKDDPNFLRASSRVYGISSSLAGKILEVRDSLPEGTFSSIDEIDNIPGISPDTMHDILYSLQVPNGNYEEEIIDILIEASRFGIEGAIPSSPFVDLGLESRKNYTKVEINERISKYEILLDEIENIHKEPDNHGKAIDILVTAMKAVFGDGFKVLPTFTAPNPQDLQTIYQDTSRIHLWLQQAAQVSPAISYLEDTIMACDAWRTRAIDSDSDYNGTLDEIVTEAFTLRVAQLPGNGERGWLALSDDELKKEKTEEEIKKMEDDIKQNGRPKGYLSIVSLAPETIDFSNKLAGLLVHKWEEKIPEKQVDTGLSFYYNQPNSQPPQSLLLAVPGELEDRESVWTVDDLIDIVRDTMDLARIRTVDPEALQYGCPFPPALFLKTESEKLKYGKNPEFYHGIWKNFLEELYCLDFNKFEVGEKLRYRIIKGFRIYSDYSDSYSPLISSNNDFNYLECKECSFVLPTLATTVDITVLNRSGTEIAAYDDKNEPVPNTSIIELKDETCTYTFSLGVIHSVLIRNDDSLAGVLKICMRPKEV